MSNERKRVAPAEAERRRLAAHFGSAPPSWLVPGVRVAWAAGVVDAAARFEIRELAGGTLRVRLRARVPEVLGRALAEIVGGKWTANDGWMLTYRSQEAGLRLLIPYLQVKRQAASVLLRYRLVQDSVGRRRGDAELREFRTNLVRELTRKL